MSAVLVWSGLLGGWLAADATAFAQLLVSQPLVGGTLAGWAWGDPRTGMQVGALLQLFALAGLPLGGRTPHDYASAGVVGPGVALIVGRTLPETSFAVPLVLGTVAGWITAIAGRPLVRWLRLRNEELTRWVEEEVRAGRAGALDLGHWLGVLHAFALGAGYTLTSLAIQASVARWAVGQQPLLLERAARGVEPVLWGVGAGLAVRQLVTPTRRALVAFLAVLVSLFASRLACAP